jgi:hypothetical protein
MRKTIKRGINTMTNDIKVVKFGGSSLADATQFKKVADIMGRGRDTVSRYVHEREAAINAVRVVVEAQNT